MHENYLLSVCVATFQRRSCLERVISCLCSVDLAVELCVVVDGSTDSTIPYLESLSYSNVKYVYQPNSGRYRALIKAVELATAPHIMFFDDDDVPIVDGFLQILDDLGKLEVGDDNVAGFIYSMYDGGTMNLLGAPFPNSRSNFLRLRADEGVKFDRKEVVRSDLLRQVVNHYLFEARRVPTSLYWFTLALNYDVICRNIVVGHKNYLGNGITDNIQKVKNSNPSPMVALHLVIVRGLIKGRYVSARFFLRSVFGVVYYLPLTLFKSMAKLKSIIMK